MAKVHGEVDRALQEAGEELQRRKTALRKASSSGVLLGVPEDESADAEAAEEEADGADAPVRAVLQARATPSPTP